MKRIRFLSIILSLFALASMRAFSEDCEHKWSYTNNGESSHTAVCTLCNQSHSDAHSLSMTRKEATCLAPATVTYECTLCSYVYSFTEGEKNPDHAWGEYETVRRASCRQTGIQSRTCPDCGQVESIEIDALEHDYGDWSQYDEQWHIRYCKSCNWAYKGSHRLNDGDIIVQPTESQLGLVKYTCRVCEDVFENILRIDGAIYAMEPKDVLSNGTSYLLAASKDEETALIQSIEFKDSGRIDLRPHGESELSVYASAKTGNYAGISVEAGETAIDVIPKIDHETVPLEFIQLEKGASASIRIFNASGAIEIEHLDGSRVMIAQAKDNMGSITTLLMRIIENRDSIELEAEMHVSSGGLITITNNGGKYDFTLSEDSQKTAFVTFKYQRSTGKITVNPRNHENTAQGTTLSILEGAEILRTAENTKTAETYVQLSSDDSAWRLRASFPNGFTLETPLFTKTGDYAFPPVRYLMDEESLLALMNVNPVPEKAEEETPAVALPEAPKETEAPVRTALPTVAPAEEASILTEDVYTINFDDVKAFACREYPAVVVQYALGTFTIDQSGDTHGWEVTAVNLVQRGASFKIMNASALPAVFEIGEGGGTVTISAQMKNGADTKEVSLGTYTVLP